jgi:hypothetical protein
MAHITAIGAGVFSDLSIAVAKAGGETGSYTPYTQANFDDAMSTEAKLMNCFQQEVASVGGVAVPYSTAIGTINTFTRIRNVREFPAMGTPPNVVNVPVFGSKTSQQIQGQADAPSMEITLNFIADEWAKGAGRILGNAVGSDHRFLFRFTLLNSEPTGNGAAKYASVGAGLGTVGNSQWFWIGKIDSLLVTPSLSDANTATIAITIQSDFRGAFTV